MRRIQRAQTNTLGLDAKSFFSKFNGITQELERLSEGGDLKTAVASIQEELVELNQEWYQRHPQEPGTISGGGEGGETTIIGFSILGLINFKTRQVNSTKTSTIFRICKQCRIFS